MSFLSGGSVKRLKLGWCPELQSFDGIYHLSSLTHFDLSDSRLLNDDLVEGLVQLSGLEELVLHGCRGITNKSIQSIANILCLRDLDISDTLVSDISPLASTLLKTLDISYCANITTVVVPQTLRELNMFSSGIKDISSLRDNLDLEKLILSRCDIADMECLACLLNLRWLDIGETKVSKVVIPPSLEYLSIFSTQITDFTGIGTVQELVASYTNIRNEDLPALANISILHLSKCQMITDISCLTSVKTLYLKGMPHLDSNADDLLLRNPDIRIITR